MADRYLDFVNTPLGKQLAGTLNLPTPVKLQRWKKPDQPFIEGKVLIGGCKDGKALAAIADVVKTGSTEIFFAEGPTSLASSSSLARSHKAKPLNLSETGSLPKLKALVFDATGIKDAAELKALYDFFHPVIRQIASSGRVVVIGSEPSKCRTPAKAAAHRALEGFVRSVGKEIGKKGATAQLLWMEAGAENQLESSLRFFLSPKSAYVSGQVVKIAKVGQGKSAASAVAPLTGKVALVTGASRGIGESIAHTLARDGATVVCLDIPAAMEALNQVAKSIEGHSLGVDITEGNSPDVIADFLQDKFGGVDLVVHNAGITRDKTLGKMPEHFWDMAVDVNMAAEERINDALFARDLIRENGRIVCVSSMSGIAGNFGQTNYALSKAGVIGYVEALARQLKKQITINAVAPGFIETQMTAAMPIGTREAGRRMNSLGQGGLPVDVAETIAWYCNPLSTGINGNVVRVCGQSLIGK
ncbi:MAG: 3-oxoacyl-ACP reductase [Alteromonadaceae bacterium]|nr:3-oxoacyl-ACP reductase [Alteromonadaceae bacterium]|tara:strand:+ start:2670 stop:4088 length:1419 start_codon:yes stop_codon:yes gene_type:complete